MPRPSLRPRARRRTGRAGSLLAVSALGLAVLGCQSTDYGPSRAETRAVAGFDRVAVEGTAGRVFVQVGVPHGVTVRGPVERLRQLRTEVVDGTLQVRTDPPNEGGAIWRDVEVVVTLPALAGLSLSCSTDARVVGLDGGSLQLDLTGAGNVAAEGSVDRLEATLAGSGDLELGALVAREASLELSGSGDAVVWVEQVVDAVLSGSGDVSVRGQPPVSRLVRTASGGVRSR